MKIVLWFSLVCVLACYSFGQKDSSLHSKLSGFPIAYYAPETRLAAGAVGLFTFHFKNDTVGSRASNLNIGAAYTLNKQILFYLPYQLYIKNDQLRFSGEIGYYDYLYYFFGVGANNATPKEQFTVKYPRVRFNAYQRINKNWFGGIRYAFDHFSNFEFDTSGVLGQMQFTGTEGKRNSGLGLGLQYDSRDNQFYPRAGYLGEIHFVHDDRWTGSAFQFSKLSIDLSSFHSVFPKSVVAANFNTIICDGQTPFYLLGMLGGGKRLRGVFEGEFRDNVATQLQVEWRQEFLKHWGVVGFAGLGVTGKSADKLDFNQSKLAGGLGVRYQLNKKEHVNIRLDLGFSKSGFYPYFTIAEAF